MHHLHEMAAAPLPYVRHARLAVLILRRDAPEQRQHLFDGRGVPAGTHGGPRARRLVPAADAASDVADAGGGAFLLAPLRGGEVLVATVEDDGGAREEWEEGGEDGVADGAVGEGEDGEVGG